jgi:hypothetical protein
VRRLTSTKSRFTLAVGTATLLVSLSVGSVLAGEVTGNGDPTPVKSYVMNSICAFSGLNDGEPPEGRTAAHVQSWGQITKADRDFLRTIGFHPGDSCNGHSGFLAGGE